MRAAIGPGSKIISEQQNATQKMNVKLGGKSSGLNVKDYAGEKGVLELKDKDFKEEYNVGDEEDEAYEKPSKLSLHKKQRCLDYPSRATNADQYQPIEKIQKDVGSEGDTITLGGCSIEFPAGSFKELTTVTIIARMDSNVLPLGENPITPILTVKVKKLLKPAIVTLSTWCMCSDESEDPRVQVVRYTASKNEFNVISTLKLGNSKSIVFKCDHFCSIFARICDTLGIWSYSIAPHIFISNNKYIFGVVKNTELMISELKKIVETAYSQSQELTCITLDRCRKKDEIKLVLSSMEKKFNFDPSSLPTKIETVVGTNNPWYNSAFLQGESEKHTFDFRWGIWKNDEKLQNNVQTRSWKTGALVDACSSTSINPTLPRTNRGNEPEIITMHGASNGGKLEQHVENTNEAFSVGAKEKGPRVVAINYVDGNTQLTQRKSNVNEMMTYGLSGEDLKCAMDAHERLSENKIRVVIDVDGMEDDYDAKLGPTKTISGIQKLLKKKTGKNYDIYRKGEELIPNLTLAQAAMEGSTMNWEAKLSPQGK